MAQQAHDMTGRKCFKCEKLFSPHSMNITISEKIDGFIIKRRVCGKCYNQWVNGRE